MSLFQPILRSLVRKSSLLGGARLTSQTIMSTANRDKSSLLHFQRETSNLVFENCRPALFAGARLILPISRMSTAAVHSDKPQVLNPQWEIARLASENSYLSYCRNGYLATVLGITMNNQAIATAADLSLALFGLGGLNIGLGTILYTMNLWTHRPYYGGSKLSTGAVTALMVLHLVLYVTALFGYLEYVSTQLGKDEENFIK